MRETLSVYNKYMETRNVKLDFIYKLHLSKTISCVETTYGNKDGDLIEVGGKESEKSGV